MTSSTTTSPLQAVRPDDPADLEQVTARRAVTGAAQSTMSTSRRFRPSRPRRPDERAERLRDPPRLPMMRPMSPGATCSETHACPVRRDVDDDRVGVVDDRTGDVLERRPGPRHPSTRFTSRRRGAAPHRPSRRRRRRRRRPRSSVVVEIVVELVVVLVGQSDGLSNAGVVIRRICYVAFFAGAALAASLGRRRTSLQRAGDLEQLADGLGRLGTLSSHATALSLSMLTRTARRGRVGADDLDEPAVRGLNGCRQRRSGRSVASSFPSASGGALLPRESFAFFLWSHLRHVGGAVLSYRTSLTLLATA